MMSPKTSLRIALAALMTTLLLGLLYWQEKRFELVGQCQAQGGQWDGRNSRCRPTPKIYIERGLKRS